MLLIQGQQGSNQTVNLVGSNPHFAHNYVTDQTAQGSQEQARGFLNAKQPLLLKQMLAAPPLISENPTQHLQHEPLLTIISPTAEQLNNRESNRRVIRERMMTYMKNKPKSANREGYLLS